ncbi:MAG: hypothetical protein R3C14_24065 [Caldilineaceae bacterium]
MTQSTILVSLVGHQPLPTLLAIRHWQPAKVILLGSNDPDTVKRRNHLVKMLKGECSQAGKPIELLETDSVYEWSMADVVEKIEYTLEDEKSQAQIVCDVTGGTKTMAIGLVQYAHKHHGNIVYIASDKLETRLFRFDFDPQSNQLVGESETPIGTQLKIVDLFRAYLGHEELEKKSERSNQNNDGLYFERDIGLGFAPYVDERENSVLVVKSGHEEADWVLRKQNRFAIVECKVNSDMMGGMRQLNNMASERYLGTYTAKILAIKTIKDAQYEDYMALAAQHNIHVLHLPDWKGSEKTCHQWNKIELAEFEKVIHKAFNF